MREWNFVATITAMGRPTKADAERKTNMLRIRLTENDRQLLDDAAESSAMDTSTWARSVLLRNARRRATTITAKWTDRSVHPRNQETDTQ